MGVYDHGDGLDGREDSCLGIEEDDPGVGRDRVDLSSG